MTTSLNDQQIEAARHEARLLIKKKAKRMIWVTFSQEGIHRYPAAAETEGMGRDDVSFLAHPHRHTFHFKVSIEVMHNDRDIEFIQFKRWLQSLYATEVMDMDFQSCEMLADDLYGVIAARYPHRDIVIEVSEDEENGVTMVYRVDLGIARMG